MSRGDVSLEQERRTEIVGSSREGEPSEAEEELQVEVGVSLMTR